mmetsp:Transcript_43963/g.64586  ORF Transcript_43963/g.64586 Transcript_43963/m.64586 type:complete len:998 (+) Transcript_43963:63-3056(+)|eukprot:CAMPEP_0195517604 /NCGR_PEP_ID=MMETSP0794_2-20130614/11034_1 /TAXON_ID=515487 /ORGANISM="Stephanopyxis turris, Strain CCMP 815" /LENGTH=997 /DNA_ID=CAMNT_0040646429 /DNA_START=62 /DNA_END=3055 /DNA_ORIENTATION=+
MKLLSSILPLILAPPCVQAKAILGVDLGSLYMKVALVQRNSPLEIVTNLHSKRKTEQMVLFDHGARFYGADASSLLARKPHLTPAAMSLMLGRHHDHPSVQVLKERHYPLTPSFNETRSGVSVNVDGTDFTPEELVAMVLTHAKDITAAYQGSGTSMVRDCVLTVPSFYTQHERRALLDAAELADLNILALIDENTAAALQYGMDRVDEKPNNVLFFNMGASSLQVSVVTFFSYEHKDSKLSKARTVGAFEVKGKAWDATLGGQAFDSKLVDYFADEFNKAWNAKRNDGQELDVRGNKRALMKLRLMANKVKHVLSANTDFPVFIDSLHDDTHFQLHITRSEFEQICHDLLLRTPVPIHKAVEAAGLTLDDIDSIELIGGAMRVPKVQEEIREALGKKHELGMHINSDESMALGAAFHGANVSTAFRVRHIGMADVNPFPIDVSLSILPDESGGGHSGLFGIGKKPEEEPKEGEEAEKPWEKKATIFKSFGKVGVKKTLAFSQESDVHCTLDYQQTDVLPAGTQLAIERYNITGVAKFAKEMSDKGLGKPKVSLQFELTTGGISKLLKAEAAVEEITIVQEEVEVDDVDDVEEEEDKKEETKEDSEKTGKEEEVKKDESEEAKDATKEETEASPEKDNKDAEEETDASAEKKDDDADGEKKEDKEESKKEEKKKKKKKKTIMVDKEKKKIHKRTLEVKSYHIGVVKPYDEQVMIESKAKLEDLAAKDKLRMMTEESKNKLESYIYHIKNKLIDDEEYIAPISTEEQREEMLKMAADYGEWLDFDGWDADMETFEAKYSELSEVAEKVFFRQAEATARPAAIAALQKKLDKVEGVMVKWETTMPQVTEEEREKVLEQVAEIRKWIVEQEDAQAKIEATETPAFISADVPKQTKSLETLIGRLSKKPKPKPIVVEKNETTDEEDKKEASAEGTEEETKDESGDNTKDTTEEAAQFEESTSEPDESASDEAAQSEESTSESDETATDEDAKEEKKEDDEL